ncbi:hypothetical protein KUTeg_010624 [Tegillarca granosa]|uniref:Uncharacterized protein n=1 Tax=Tegillarca granosa TaxID=220873 RepID=A0ABQ9F343_TEGGR|nr:hypothetical protein KUTeg_010624 [Tegillarca granosa]
MEVSRILAKKQKEKDCLETLEKYRIPKLVTSIDQFLPCTYCIESASLSSDNEIDQLMATVTADMKIDSVLDVIKEDIVLKHLLEQ